MTNKINYYIVAQIGLIGYVTATFKAFSAHGGHQAVGPPAPVPVPVPVPVPASFYPGHFGGYGFDDGFQDFEQFSGQFPGHFPGHLPGHLPYSDFDHYAPAYTGIPFNVEVGPYSSNFAKNAADMLKLAAYTYRFIDRGHHCRRGHGHKSKLHRKFPYLFCYFIH